MKSPLNRGFPNARRLFCAFLLLGPAAFAQSESNPAAQENQPEIASKIEKLTKSLEQTQVELAQSRTEIQQLRATLQEVLVKMNSLAPGPSNTGVQDTAVAPVQPSSPQVPSEDAHAAQAQVSQDDWDILNARVEEQRQTKVESA
jgi:hypothetical protein